jgi:hypothetical protein
MNEYSAQSLGLMLYTLKGLSLEKRTEILTILESNSETYFPGMYEQLVEHINECEFEDIPELFGDEHAETVASYLEDITEEEILREIA